jgi:hypothetical protein
VHADDVLGRLVTLAHSMTGSEEVVVARIAPGLQISVEVGTAPA